MSDEKYIIIQRIHDSDIWKKLPYSSKDLILINEMIGKLQKANPFKKYAVLKE